MELQSEVPLLPLAPVGRETVQDRVYAELRRALVGGLLAPGQTLTIRALAEQLMTSTMPVRDAIGRLVTEQALEVLPNRTIRVPLVTLARIDDLLQARLLIEGEAIACAATRLDAAGLARIRQILARDETRPGVHNDETIYGEVSRNRAFHFEIYAACGSAVLLPMIESLWLQSGPCSRAGTFAFSEAGQRDTARYHYEMVAALEARDAEAARAALAADISRPFAFLRRKLSAEAVAA